MFKFSISSQRNLNPNSNPLKPLPSLILTLLDWDVVVQIFSSIDDDGGGTLSIEELYGLLETLEAEQAPTLTLSLSLTLTLTPSLTLTLTRTEQSPNPNPKP